MKKILHHIWLLLIFISCKQDVYKPLVLKSPDDNMKMSASKDTFALEEKLKDDVAVTFEWGDATYRGEGTEITYYFKLDIANNKFATSIPKIKLDPSQQSISFTHGELQSLITGFWKKKTGESVSLEAEIIADVTIYPQYMKPEVSRKIITVTSYIEKVKDLYLVGSAANRAIPLTMQSLNEEYVWKGDLVAGTFKFTLSKEDELPSYNRGTNEETLRYRTESGEPDDLFTINQAGRHAIYVNLKEMRIRHSSLPFENLWIVGDAVSAGWDISNPVPMTWNPANPEVFTYEGPLNQGYMKMPVKKGDWGTDFFMPVEADADISDKRVQFVPGGVPDYKWKVNEAGNYRITLNVIKLTINFEKI